MIGGALPIKTFLIPKVLTQWMATWGLLLIAFLIPKVLTQWMAARGLLIFSTVPNRRNAERSKAMHRRCRGVLKSPLSSRSRKHSGEGSRRSQAEDEINESHHCHHTA